MDKGAGKTLVAALFLARMQRLNPGRVAVMVVDRVPLVFQQARAITKYTGMRGLRLCSETRTKKGIDRLMERSGRYQFVVVTAGLLRNLVENGDIPVSVMSSIVFDECHHARGEHVYSWLLKKVAECGGGDPSYRPRLLGLSASPVPSKTVKEALDGLKELRRAFLGAEIVSSLVPTSYNDPK